MRQSRTCGSFPHAQAVVCRAGGQVLGTGSEAGSCDLGSVALQRGLMSQGCHPESSANRQPLPCSRTRSSLPGELALACFAQVQQALGNPVSGVRCLRHGRVSLAGSQGTTLSWDRRDSEETSQTMTRKSSVTVATKSAQGDSSALVMPVACVRMALHRPLPRSQQRAALSAAQLRAVVPSAHTDTPSTPCVCPACTELGPCQRCKAEDRGRSVKVWQWLSLGGCT